MVEESDNVAGDADGDGSREPDPDGLDDMICNCLPCDRRRRTSRAMQAMGCTKEVKQKIDSSSSGG